MNEKNEISLLLTPVTAETQCLETIKQARNASHALAALIALQSFILATAHPSDRFTPAYDAIKAVVEKHAAGIRIQILAEHSEALAEAIRQRSPQEVARIHAALSRNGFWQAAQQAMQQLGADELAAAAAWASDWCLTAKNSAEAASGYPDALDFSKAGIAATEYAAMTEINLYFTDVIG
jgi:hypothetical protein